MATLGSLGAALRQQQAPGQARRRYRAAQPLRRWRPLQPPREFGIAGQRRCRVNWSRHGMMHEEQLINSSVICRNAM